MPRAVLDTNILISALITPRGTPAKVLQSWRAGHFDVVTSQPLLLELREALSRPHLIQTNGDRLFQFRTVRVSYPFIFEKSYCALISSPPVVC